MKVSSFSSLLRANFMIVPCLDSMLHYWKLSTMQIRARLILSENLAMFGASIDFFGEKSMKWGACRVDKDTCRTTSRACRQALLSLRQMALFL